MIGIVGAGRTGRGFLARLLVENQAPFVMFDQDRDLVEKLKGGYQISFFSGVRTPIAVRDYQILHTEDAACRELLPNMETIFVSVGGTNLESVSRWLASMVSPEMLQGPCQNIIFCENARDPAEKARKLFLNSLPEDMREKADAHFGFMDAAVFCTTIQTGADNRDIESEDYPSLPFDVLRAKGNPPHLKGITPVKDFQNVLMRKIYTYNSASGIIAYLGWWKGYKIYADAANDPEILGLLDQNYREIGRAICAEYGYSEEDQAAFAALSKAKFCDRAIVDTVSRNAREPMRKLSAGERIVGPAMLIEKYGGDTGILALTAAAALLYSDPDDPQWEMLKRQKTEREVFLELSGLNGTDLFAKQVFESVKILKQIGRGVLPDRKG